MELKRAGSQPSIKGPEEWFTGAVRIDRSTSRLNPLASRSPASPSNRRPHRLAHPSSGADPYRHGGLRLDPMRR